MSADVIKLADISPEQIENFRAKKILQQEDEIEIDLDAVGGNPVIGELNPSEIVIFNEFTALEADLADISKELTAKALESGATAARAATDPQKILEMMQESRLMSDEDAEEFARDADRYQYLYSCFWFTVRDRLQSFNTHLGIRAGYKVVRYGYKHRR